MTNPITYRPHSDEFDDLVRGYVMASRINDVVADPGSQRYLDYLHFVSDQFKGEPVVDPSEEYRERAKALVPRALEAYELRDGCEVRQNLLYRYPDEAISIAATPDGMEGDLLGITVHCRKNLRTYRDAIAEGVTDDMDRHSQAMMVVTGAEMWAHLDYFEDAEHRIRKLHDHVVTFNETRAAKAEAAMLVFLLKTRQLAVST